uniref:Uncharacterized protein n=1 Tax=Sipha flava TaxID=143950 RepID=A0A2S2RA29_9HEMI
MSKNTSLSNKMSFLMYYVYIYYTNTRTVAQERQAYTVNNNNDIYSSRPQLSSSELHNNVKPRNNIPIIVSGFEKKAAGMSGVRTTGSHSTLYTVPWRIEK